MEGMDSFKFQDRLVLDSWMVIVASLFLDRYVYTCLAADAWMICVICVGAFGCMSDLD